MYEDMYKDYSCETFHYHYPISFECRNRDYLQLVNPIKVCWVYGDTIPLKFNLLDRYPDDEEDIPEYFENKTGKVTFYNFRLEEIYSWEFDSSAIQFDDKNYYVQLDIDSQTSLEIFRRGIYYCGMVLTDTETGDVETLLYYDKCSIMVK